MAYSRSLRPVAPPYRSMGAAGAMILAMLKGRLTFDLTRQAVESTATMTSFVMFILIESPCGG